MTDSSLILSLVLKRIVFEEMPRNIFERFVCMAINEKKMRWSTFFCWFYMHYVVLILTNVPVNWDTEKKIMLSKRQTRLLT